MLVKEASKSYSVSNATFKTETESKEASKRLEVIPATYKTVSEQFMVTPSDRSLSVDNNIQFKPVTERIMIRPSYVTYQIIPAQFNNVSERMMLREAAPSAKVPKFKTETERILVKAASKRYEAIPATYKTVTKTVVIKEPIKTLSITAPIYETDTERVIIWDSYTRYEKGKVDPTLLSANPDDCRVLCLVEIPGEYKTITKTVLKTPARITKSVSPAQTRTITKRIIDRPASVREIDVPAEYTITNMSDGGSYAEWVGILREAQVTTDRIISIQRALKAADYNPGPIDNILGSQTKSALLQYQKDKNLPQGNLNLETLKSLDVSY